MPDAASPPRGRRRWPWLAVAALVVLVGALAAFAWAFWPTGLERARNEAYRVGADGLTLEIQYSSGHPCEDAVVKRVLEYESTVVVDVAFRAYPRGAAVPDIAYVCEESFLLTSPVGNRVVTDVDGHPIIGPWDMVVPS